MDKSRTNQPVVDLRAMLERVDNVISIGGLVLNSILLYLIVNKTPSRLMDYRPILIQNCLIDFFYNIVNSVTKTQTEYKNGNFYLLLTGPPAYSPYPWNLILLVLWVFSIIYCLTSVPVQFVYRYFLICRGGKMNRLRYALLLLSAFFFALMYGIGTVFTFPQDPELWNESRKLLEQDVYYYEGIPNFVVASIDRIRLKLLFAYCYLLVFVSYSITVIANVKVWRHLKSMENQMSQQARDVQRQITTTLAVQAVVPGIICCIPIATAVTMTFLHANVPGLGMCVSLVWSWIPVANPLLTIIVVKSYRKTVLLKLKRFMPCFFNSSSISPTVESVQQIQKMAHFAT